MADGIWKMNDEGEFELDEPYATQLAECKVAATRAWYAAAVGYLVERCPYSAEELKEELLRRNEVRDGPKADTFDEFILEALSGDL